MSRENGDGRYNAGIHISVSCCHGTHLNATDYHPRRGAVDHALYNIQNTIVKTGGS